MKRVNKTKKDFEAAAAKYEAPIVISNHKPRI